MISFCAVTNKGGRSYNEDAMEVLVEDDRWCCILADGLGGMGGGADASKAVVDTLKYCFESGYMNEETLHACCQKAHDAIIEKKETLHQAGRMYATVVLVYGTAERLYWTHCGDSRLYLFCDDTICFCTKDHSVPQMLVNCGEIKPEEIRFHPDRNRLLSCLGNPEQEPNLSAIGAMDIRSGLVGLLCSDGFWEPLTEAQILQDLSVATDVERWLKKMVSQIRKKPMTEKMDNFTAIGIWAH